MIKGISQNDSIAPSHNNLTGWSRELKEYLFTYEYGDLHVTSSVARLETSGSIRIQDSTQDINLSFVSDMPCPLEHNYYHILHWLSFCRKSHMKGNWEQSNLENCLLRTNLTVKLLLMYFDPDKENRKQITVVYKCEICFIVASMPDLG